MSIASIPPHFEFPIDIGLSLISNEGASSSILSQNFFCDNDLLYFFASLENLQHLGVSPGRCLRVPIKAGKRLRDPPVSAMKLDGLVCDLDRHFGTIPLGHGAEGRIGITGVQFRRCTVAY